MKRSTKSALASLLMTAMLALPNGAMASTAVTVAETKPAPAMPAPGGESELLVTPKLTRDEAIALVKQYFTIPAELGEPNVGIQQSRESAYWTLQWQSPSKQAERTRISASVDAVTGVIMGYSYSTSGQDQPLELSYTRAEAKEMAREWFEKLVPEEYRSSLRFQESPLNAGYWGGSVYQFNWVREVEGYPLTGNNVQISIDARTGEMTQYNLFWQPNVDLTLPEQSLSQEQAEQAYRAGVPMVLQYQRFQKRGTDESEWRLVYRPLTGEFPRMNQEGQLIDWEGKPFDLEALKKAVPVPASEKPYTKPATPLEMEEALAVAQALTGRTDAPNQSSYSEGGEETKRRTWDFTWTTQPEEEGRMAGEMRVRIDAETGLVTEYWHWSETKPFDKDEAVPVTLEQAQETAIKFIRTYRPDLAGNLQLTPQMERWANPEYRPTEYYMNFQQLKDGILVNGSGVQVSVSARTGEVRNFWGGSLEEGEFPSPTAQVTPAKAMEVFLREQGIEAAWFSFYNREKGEPGTPVLLWQPQTHLSIQSIDAKSGAPLDYEGRNLIEAQRYPADIKGHYAEREIELLWARGVFELQDGKFNPDMVISADELARWIVLARGLRPYMSYDFAMLESAAGAGQRAAKQAAKSDNSAYFGAALQSGIILPEDFELIGDLNSPVTRELFALWAVRAMGYGRIAKMEARIEMDFADKDQIGDRYQNAVAILAGLKIIAGDGSGNFGPQQWLSRGQAAKILYAVSTAR